MAVWRIPIEMQGTWAGGPGVNVWHGRTSAGEGSPLEGEQLQGIVDALRAFYNTISTLYVNKVTLALGPIVNEATKVATTKTFTAIPPSATAGAAPPHLAIVLGWRSSLAARRGIGRTFIGPVHSGNLNTDGTPEDGSLTIVRNAAQTLLNASLTDNGWALGVWGQEAALPPGSEANAQTPRVLRDFVNFRVRDQWAVRRSRRP